MIVTCVAPVNIAVIKYWGKRDEELILPLNDSISATLDTEQIHAKTTIMASPNFKEDRMWLNGREVPVDTPRVQNCLKEIFARAELMGCARYKKLAGCHLHICSENNFPTGAGLASSAAGYACLVFAMAKLVGLEGDISGIARLGSGSACRSIPGGFVHWHRGVSVDGSDSIATQLVAASHWPELRIVILVVNDKQKAISSKVGMKKTVETSELLRHRIAECVPLRVKKMVEAIQEKNFKEFGELTMKESNQFHAVCLDTYPPLIYLSDVSHAIVNFVHTFNATDVQVAYTFDAGPNACLFVLEETFPRLLATLNYVFPPENNSVEYLRGISVKLPHVDKDDLQLAMEPKAAGLLKYIVSTRLGSRPQEMDDHLLTAAGEPKHVAKEVSC